MSQALNSRQALPGNSEFAGGSVLAPQLAGSGRLSVLADKAAGRRAAAGGLAASRPIAVPNPVHISSGSLMVGQMSAACSCSGRHDGTGCPAQRLAMFLKRPQRSSVGASGGRSTRECSTIAAACQGDARNGEERRLRFRIPSGHDPSATAAA